MNRRILIAAGILLAVTGASAGAFAGDKGQDRDDKHGRADEVFRLRQKGTLKPLSEIMETVQKQFPGQILKTEFEKSDGRIVYEFYILQTDGIVREIKADARSGQILATEAD